PIADLVRALTPVGARAAFADREREVVERLCPETADEPFELSHPMPRNERERFHQAAAELFLTLAAGNPVVLVVEDVSYCDAGSAALLSAVLRRAKEAQVLVVVTAGPAATHGPVPRELIEAAGRDVLRIPLTPLPREGVGRLIAALLGVAKVPAALTDTVAAHSKGNPLLVEELVALFIDRGEIKRGERGWALDEFDTAAAAPTALLEVLSERVARLGENERRSLSALAVFNRPSGPKLLSAIGGISRAEVRQALSSAESQGLIRVVGEEEGRPRV